MASSDGLDEDCVLQRGRSQSDPSSITEVRLGEAHRAGKRSGGPKCYVVDALWTSLVCALGRCLDKRRVTVAGGSPAARHTGHIRGDPSGFVCNKRRLC